MAVLCDNSRTKKGGHTSDPRSLTTRKGDKPLRKILALLSTVLMFSAIGFTAPALAAASPAPHVFLLVMENYGAKYEVQQAPVQALMAKYAAATNYSGATNPSLPNYLALTSGQWATDSFSDQYPGQTGDYPNNAPWNVPNLFDQLQTAGISWGAYAEGYNLPAGWNYDTLEGNGYGFAGHHFPALYYTDATSSTTMMSHLQRLSNLNTLLAGPASGVPSFVTITPTPQNAKSLPWLTSEVNAITASAAWKAGGVLIVTWDNAPTFYGTLPGFTQAPDTNSGGGNVLTLVISPRVTAGTKYTQMLSHYSTLRSIETAFGLPLLGNAQTAPAWPQLVSLIEPPAAPAANTSPMVSEQFSPVGTNPSITSNGITLSAVGQGQVALAFFKDGYFTPIGAQGTFSSVTLTATSSVGTFSLGGQPMGMFDSTTHVATWTISPTASPALWSAFHFGSP